MRCAVVAAVLLVLARFSVAAPTAWDLNTNQTIDLVNVANNFELPYGNTTFASDSLARSPGGTLYSADGFGNLWNVTGPPIPVAPLGFAQIGDLGYASGGLWGFSNASQTLFFFDLGSLAVTYSAVFPSLSAVTITGVAPYAVNGDVYLSGYAGLNNDLLFRVPSMSSTAQFVGSMADGDGFSYFSDIEFGQNGSLYGMTFFHRYFYQISTTTAATTLLSMGPHRDTTGMALQPMATPEPGPMAMVPAFAGMASIAITRRRRVDRLARGKYKDG